VGNIKTSQKLIIIFYDHELKDPKGIQGSNLPLHIISKVDGKIFKIILVDGGSTINIISTTAYNNLNIPFLHMCAPSLFMFNNRVNFITYYYRIKDSTNITTSN